MANNAAKIKICKDGPYTIKGGLPLAKEFIVGDENKDSIGYKKGAEYECLSEYSLCRCGQSKQKPFCDGTHARVVFDGTETASKENFKSRCGKISGPGLNLDDLPELCARARFCHDQKGDVWNNTERSNDPRLKKEAERQAQLCPSGRLVARRIPSGETIEPDLKMEIGLIEDPQKNVSGPVWVKGGVKIESADGQKYEIRNRVTLCRCGKSKKKPFCDGRHIDEKFSDGDPNL